MLIARDVAIADRGDGIGARVHALRLELNLPGLLRGRLIPRALVLDRPVVTLPWPLPHPFAPALPAGFSARLEGAAITLGGAQLTAVDATLQSDPDTGAFTASGAATLGGLIWHFNVLLGAPGNDGVATLAVTLDGQGAAQGIGGNLRGRLTPDGALTGQIALRGPDLSRLLPAPAAAFSAQGPITLTHGVLRSDDLALLLANSAGQAHLTWHLEKPFSVDATATIGQVALDAWLPSLTAAPTPFPAHMRLSTQAATLRGHILRDAAIDLTLGGRATAIEDAHATLPGNGLFAARGTVSPTGPSFAGDIHLTGDAHAVLAWAWPDAANFLGETPGQADLTASLTLSPTSISLANVAARLGQATAKGTASVQLGAKPALALDLAVDQVTLPANPPAWPAAWLTVPAHVQLHMAHGSWRGVHLTNAVLDAQTGPFGVTLRQASLDAATAHLQATGTAGWDGMLTAAHLDIAAADANALLLTLPADWRHFARLFYGAAHLAITASGPPTAITADVLADLNDLRAEGELRLDAPARALTATATLRHPSAPTLLTALGVPDSEQFLDRGSLALTAHLTASHGHLAAPDFSLSAGVLRLYGSASLDLSGAVPAVDAQLHAETLALPGLSPHATEALPFDVLAGWQGRAQINATQLLLDLRPVAQNLAATLTLSGGVLAALPVTAELNGGKASLAAALDGQATPPTLVAQTTFSGVGLPAASPAFLPQAPFGGTLDASVAFTASGFSPAALLASASGAGQGTLTGISLPGIDLDRLAHLLAAHDAKRRPLLIAALSSGDTGPLSGPFALSLDQGALTLAPTHVQGRNGAIDFTGVFDLTDQSAEAKYRVLAAVPNAPALGVTLSGAWSTPHRTTDVAPALTAKRPP